MISEFSANLSDSLLVKIGESCHYHCHQIIFDAAQSFVGLSLNCTSYIIIKGIVIWDRQLFGLGVMSQKFSHCQAWVLLLVWHGVRYCCQMKGSCSRLSLGPEKYYLLQALHVNLHTESEVTWENEWKYNINIASDHPRHHDVNWLFSFHHCWYMFSGQRNSENLPIAPSVCIYIYIYIYIYTHTVIETGESF